MVLLDCDLIVTRPLTEVLALAREGKIVAFQHDHQRHDSRWGELLRLGAVPRRTYLDFAMLGLGASTGGAVLERLEELQTYIDFERTMWGSHDMSYPLVYADQDVLNAIVAATVNPREIVVLDSRLAPVPPFEGLSVRDACKLRCAYDDGVEPIVVHHFLVKPWREPTHHGVYSKLLRRLLICEDVAVQVPEGAIPRRWRRGVRAWLGRSHVNARERIRFHLRGP
jgi:lipopolysaccharide biosynthesis glycosyltransferase